MITDFKILRLTEANQLQDAVCKLINNPDDPMDDSWQPHGPLIVERVHAQNQFAGLQQRSTLYTLHYIQAMVKIS